MRIKVTIRTSDQRIPVNFGVVHNISDGGYERGREEGETIGYEKGLTEGKTEGYNNGYTEGETAGYEKGHTDGVTEGYEQGKQSEYDRFWDNYQDHGKRTKYDYAFSGSGWTDETFKPKYTPIVLTGNVYETFRVSKVSYIDESHVDCSGATLIQHFLYQSACDKPVTVIMNIASCTRLSNTFIYSSKLETLELKNIREDCDWVNALLSCTGLVNFRCTGTIGRNISFASCKKLSDESVQNIIDHLKDLTGQTAQAVSFHTDVILKLTDEQALAISAKNWSF